MLSTQSDGRLFRIDCQEIAVIPKRELQFNFSVKIKFQKTSSQEIFTIHLKLFRRCSGKIVSTHQNEITVSLLCMLGFNLVFKVPTLPYS